MAVTGVFVLFVLFAGLAYLPQSDRLETLHVLLELLVSVAATHLFSVCVGLWFTDREPRWILLGVAYAVVSALFVAHLLSYVDTLGVGARPGELPDWVRGGAISVSVLVSVVAITARSVSLRAAVLSVGAIVLSLIVAWTALRSGADLTAMEKGAGVFNVLVCALGVAGVWLNTRHHPRNGAELVLAAVALSAFAAAIFGLIGRPWPEILPLVLQIVALATLYCGLLVLGLLRPYRYSRRAEEFFRMLVERSPAGIVLSRDGRILHANRAFLDLLGFESIEKAKEAFIWDLDAQDPEEGERYLRAREKDDRSVPNTVVRRLVARDGRVIHARVEHTPVNIPDGRAMLTHFIDFSRTVEAQEQLQRIANYDVLTGLPNRALLRAQLDQALRVAERVGDMVAVLFVDLDQFKQVNDTLGHASGDELLKMVANRLRGVCRKEDTLGRLGGDEFIVVGQHMQSQSGAATLASKLIQALDMPFDLEGHKVFVGGSVGVSMFPRDAANAGTMIRNADVAMYHAKRGGGPRVAFYEEEMNARALERLELGTELRWALDRDEFELFFQPRVEPKTGRVAGAEALLRWRSPTRGLVLPERFVPRLEESGLIVQLGRQVLAKACHAAMEWRAAGVDPIPVAVNLSAAQFRGSVVEDVELALGASGLPHHDLELEITETLLFRDYEQARVPLEKLTAKGVRAALDDFGTGYSSLSSLHNLPVQFVKIDRSFVHALKPGRNTIVAAIVNVAHTLRMKVIAEGVETAEQRDILMDLGCDEMQGHFFAAAMSAEEFSHWLLHRSARHLFAVGEKS